MDAPSQAVILCGGCGVRLRPITDHIPKPMVRIHARPFLEYLILQLKKQGISEVLLLTGYLGEKIQEYFRQTALVNPYANIKYTDPKNNVFDYNRVINVMPSNPKETQPHPYGVDVETIRRLINSNSYNLVDSNHKLLENELLKSLITFSLSLDLYDFKIESIILRSGLVFDLLSIMEIST